MRFIGLLLVLFGMAISYFIGYRGMSINDARTKLSQLLNVPGLAPPGSSSSSHPPPPPKPGNPVTSTAGAFV